MTDTPVAAGVMTLDEFIRRYDTEGPFEILEGEIIPKMATVIGHSVLAKRAFMALLPFEQQGVGEIFQEAPYVLSYSADWVRGSRIPDLMFVAAARLAAYQASDPQWRAKPLVLVPDMVIEIVSPTDAYSEVARRVARYLSDGVRLVWVVDPQVRQVMVHTLDGVETLGADAVLTGGGVLPDLRLPLTTLFGAPAGDAGDAPPAANA